MQKVWWINQEILSIDVEDRVEFKIKNSEPIREDDDYGGIKYNILAIFENIRVNLSIDIATGDIITPKEIEYEYKMIFEDRSLNIMTYNIETIIAEKFQTVISRNVLNSRMKDYYDLYYLLTYKKFSKDILKTATINTLKKRETDINEIDKQLDKISKSDFVIELWTNYTKKYQYAENIQFEDIINIMYKKKID